MMIHLKETDRKSIRRNLTDTSYKIRTERTNYDQFWHLQYLSSHTVNNYKKNKGVQCWGCRDIGGEGIDLTTNSVTEPTEIKLTHRELCRYGCCSGTWFLLYPDHNKRSKKEHVSRIFFKMTETENTPCEIQTTVSYLFNIFSTNAYSSFNNKWMPFKNLRAKQRVTLWH